MSKKDGKKQKAKIPEIDPDSPEWQREVARKQGVAYDMVQRAMLRSQIGVMLTTRDEVERQKLEIETKISQQSQDQNDIYHYLRKRLKDNYVAIAELETQVSRAHEDRLKREKDLIATASVLDEKRKSEKIRLQARLETLDAELEAIKDFQDNSATFEQKLRDLEGRISGCKENFRSEVALLNAQIEEEWEKGRKYKEERIKITKKAAAKATQEQLGPRTKHMIAQNKKMMAELRFQCFEVEKMQRAREGLLKSNSLLLAKAASARHGAGELARRSHLLQKIIRHMHQKLLSRRVKASGARAWRGDGALGSSTDGDMSPGAGEGASGMGVNAGVGQRYKLAGMSEEDRQQLLDLREELHREEVAIAAAQALLKEKREADDERNRVLVLKADLARVLASCHEDPLLGGCTSPSGALTAANSNDARRSVETSAQATAYPALPGKSPTVASPPPISTDNNGDTSLEKARGGADGDGGCDGGACGARGEGMTTPGQDEETSTLGPDTEGLSTVKLPSIDTTLRQKNAQHRRQRTGVGTSSFVDWGGGSDDGESSGREDGSRVRQQNARSGGGLPVWPESAPLPIVAVSWGGSPGEAEEGGGQRGEGSARFLEPEVLKAVSRLFLSKLHVSTETITPRLFEVREQPRSLPLLAALSPDGGVSCTVPGKDRRNGRDKERMMGDGCDNQGQRISHRNPSVGHAHDGAWGSVGTGRRRDDESGIWSDRQTTGIPSWDILETAVRQTKRRRTRDAACQTLTYRELRDDATSSNHSACTKSGASQTQTNFWVQTESLPSRRALKADAPGSLRSLATTASGVSMYRGSPDGGTVHGAVIRGGGCTGAGVGNGRAGRGITRRRPSLRHGRGQIHTGVSDTGGSVTLQANARGAHLDDRLPCGGQGIEIVDEMQHRPPHQQQQQVTPAMSPIRRPGTTGTQHHCRRSPSAGLVAVSWGEGDDMIPAGAAPIAVMETASMAEIDGGGRGLDQGISNQSNREGDATGVGRRGSKALRDTTGVGRRGTRREGGGIRDAYAPLSKGPDYRKVLLYTVDDDDHLNMPLFRVPATSAASDAANFSSPGAGVTFLHGKDQLAGLPASSGGGPPIVLNNVHQKDRSTGAAKTARTSTAAAMTAKRGRSAVRSPGRIARKDLLRGRGQSAAGGTTGNVTSVHAKGKGGGGGGGSGGGNRSRGNGWDSGTGGGGLCGGPTLCSSVSTLSGSGFEPQ